MAGYKVLRHCRYCKKKFFVDKISSRVYHCEDCEEKNKKNLEYIRAHQKK